MLRSAGNASGPGRFPHRPGRTIEDACGARPVYSFALRITTSGSNSSDELVGRALAGGRHARSVLATKAGLLTNSVQAANPASS
jgi:hypothetical protein